MKYTFKKIVKGTIAIFVVKLVLVTGIFVFQSCQSETFNEATGEELTFNDNFAKALQASAGELNSIPLNLVSSVTNNSNVVFRDMTLEVVTMCLYGPAVSNPKDVSDVDDIEGAIESNTLIGVLDETKDPAEPVKPVKGDDDQEEPFDGMVELSCFEVPLDPIYEALDPAIVEAKNYLENVAGWNSSDISEVLDGHDESMLIPFVSILTSFEEGGTVMTNSDMQLKVIQIFGIQSSYATSSTMMSQNSNFGDCFMQAIGADALVAAAEVAGQLFAQEVAGELAEQALKTIAKKAIKEIAKKLLGPIGVAIAVIEFATCMY